MFTDQDQNKIGELLQGCQHFLSQQNLNHIPGNFAQLKEAALLKELADELPKLTGLFSADSTNEARLKSSFIQLCAQREVQNRSTCMSYTAIPEGICNRLYLDIAVILFKPAHFGELIAVLLPAIKANLAVELILAQSSPSAEACKNAEEKVQVSLKQASLAALSLYPAEWSILTQVATDENVVFNLENIVYMPLLLRRQFHRLLADYPILRKNKRPERQKVIALCRADESF